MKTFTCGLIIGCTFTYIAFQSHLIWTAEGLLFIPKQPATPLNGTFVDVRDWKPSDWRKHPHVYSAVENANRLDLTRPIAAAPEHEAPTDSERALNDFLHDATRPSSSERSDGNSRQQAARQQAARQQAARQQAAPRREPRDVPGPVRSWNDPRHPMSGPSSGQTVRPVYNRFQDELDRTYRESRMRGAGTTGAVETGAVFERSNAGRTPQTAGRSVVRPQSEPSGR